MTVKPIKTFRTPFDSPEESKLILNALMWIGIQVKP